MFSFCLCSVVFVIASWTSHVSVCRCLRALFDHVVPRVIVWLLLNQAVSAVIVCSGVFGKPLNTRIYMIAYHRSLLYGMRTVYRNYSFVVFTPFLVGR